MTVAELIALLSAHRLSADVALRDADTEWRMDPDEVVDDDDGVVVIENIGYVRTYDERIKKSHDA